MRSNSYLITAIHSSHGLLCNKSSAPIQSSDHIHNLKDNPLGLIVCNRSILREQLRGQRQKDKLKLSIN